MQIEARTSVFFEDSMREHGSSMSFVRSFVLGKTSVPVNPIDRSFWRREHFRRKFLKIDSERLDQFRHGLLNNIFVNTFVLLKPFTIIIAFQRAQESQAL